ncbi:cyclic AMP-dependent transcription factor ATF-2-like isoform X3 [Pomacea canaliculata]|nr:cyclic AMP-dependent transcription factor ATF-2-like isoform X3 [Pomacea canaliculata]
MCDVDNDKPFVCSSHGCGMRFTNEDHLNVHMKKHEMSLALNLGGHNSSPGHHFLDQTPTPTKFLKNCEEIGLFQELSKNPFEEAFKKASDSEVVPLPGPHTNELNTPIPPSLHDKTPGGFLLHDVQSPTSTSTPLMKPEAILIASDQLALNLSGRKSSEKSVIMQPSSTTGEDEEVRVISMADSTQSPSKTVPSASPLVKEVIVTQAVSSSLSGTVTTPTQVILASLPPATEACLAGQPVLTTSSPIQPQVSQQPIVAAVSPSQQACTMQVYLQLPTGQTVPVHIPATISAVLPTGSSEHASGQQPQQLPKQQQPQPAKVAIRQNNTNSAPVTSTSTMALKQRLKQTLQAAQQQQQQQQQQQGVVSSSSGRSDSGISVARVQPQASPVTVTLDSPKVEVLMSDFEIPSKRYKGGGSESDDPDERRRKFLERNRAAAARCRQKRKHWITNLEKKAEELQQTNSRLQSEVSLLKAEVAELKTLLLAHQDCPITLQQKSQGQLALHTISMVESASTLPFDVTQLVGPGSVGPVTVEVNRSLCPP